METKKKSKDAKIAEKALKEAVADALKTHAKSGIPAVFLKNGKIVYRLPNGKIVNKEPVKIKIK